MKKYSFIRILEKVIIAILLGLGGLISFCVIFLIGYTIINDRSCTDPKKIADDAGWDMPKFEVIDEDGSDETNMSSWITYDWDIKLKQPLSKDDLTELRDLCKENSCWKNENDTFIYNKEENGYGSYIRVEPKTKKVVISYSWQELW